MSAARLARLCRLWPAILLLSAGPALAQRGAMNRAPTDPGTAPAGPAPTAAPAPAAPGGAGQRVEPVLWDRTPIHITLPIGVERVVHFPAPVRVGVPQTVAGVLRTQTVAGSVYWLARAPFAAARVQVRETGSGRTYLLDLEAVAGSADTAPVYVQVPPAPPVTGPTTPADQAAGPHPAPEPPRYDYVTLVRFAAQQLYAPERLLQDLPGVARVPVRRRKLPLYQGGAVEALPQISWSDGTLYVTAVKLTNVTAQPVLLDPRAIRGHWLARALLYSRLEPAGDAQGADSALVFLLSPRPFEDNF